MDKSILTLFNKLNEVYDSMPNAIGCIGCGKCCMVQHPHCFQIEFYYILSEIENWTKEEKEKLHIDCIKNYLSNSLEKKCVFLDENKKCKIYSYRDYNCRAFGIIPKKVYSKRVKNVKKNFLGVRLTLEKQSDCCGGVKAEEYIGKNKLDFLFEEIKKLDLELGVSQESCDNSDNYMTFHDHYLLHYYGKDVNMIKALTKIKTNSSEKEKEKFIFDLEDSFGFKKGN
ncbi:MAG: YkgJ family cysteine cluster protein [bacterium]